MRARYIEIANNRILLPLDNFSAHQDEDAIRLLDENGIDLLSFRNSNLKIIIFKTIVISILLVKILFSYNQIRPFIQVVYWKKIFQFISFLGIFEKLIIMDLKEQSSLFDFDSFQMKYSWFLLWFFSRVKVGVFWVYFCENKHTFHQHTSKFCWIFSLHFFCFIFFNLYLFSSYHKHYFFIIHIKKIISYNYIL